MYEKIKEALLAIDSKVYYGIGRFQGRTEWDCIVFGRRRRKRQENGMSAQKKWFVAIVREEYIPEGLEDETIAEMKKIGMKLSGDDILYDYVEKSGESIVEICTMEFQKIEKGCKR